MLDSQSPLLITVRTGHALLWQSSKGKNPVHPALNAILAFWRKGPRIIKGANHNSEGRGFAVRVEKGRSAGIAETA